MHELVAKFFERLTAIIVASGGAGHAAQRLFLLAAKWAAAEVEFGEPAGVKRSVRSDSLARRGNATTQSLTFEYYFGSATWFGCDVTVHVIPMMSACLACLSVDYFFVSLRRISASLIELPFVKVQVV